VIQDLRIPEFCWHLAFNPTGALYLASTNQLFKRETEDSDVERVDPENELLNHMGSRDLTCFHSIGGICCNGAGDLLVTDFLTHTISCVSKDRRSSILAGAFQTLGFKDGPRQESRFYRPTGVCVSASSTIFVIDQSNSVIRRITESGLVSTIQPSSSWEGDVGRWVDLRHLIAAQSPLHCAFSHVSSSQAPLFGPDTDEDLVLFASSSGAVLKIEPGKLKVSEIATATAYPSFPIPLICNSQGDLVLSVCTMTSAKKPNPSLEKYDGIFLLPSAHIDNRVVPVLPAPSSESTKSSKDRSFVPNREFIVKAKAVAIAISPTSGSLVWMDRSAPTSICSIPRFDISDSGSEPEE
jgi:hypothetical protein